uniref:Glycosyltransferase n=1 Tax=viral metagenome TaxID=1070528 RepID=A0A6M3KTV3_9ZZZZ
MIDYCTILFDERERVLLPLHINSLRHYAPDTFNIKVSVRPEDTESIELCEKFGLEVLPHPIYTQLHATLDYKGYRHSGYDTANRLGKLMESCTSDWVVLSHLDIVWLGHPLNNSGQPGLLPIKHLMTDEYGALGIYPHGSMALNRKAYNGCHCGFWPLNLAGKHYTIGNDSWVDVAGYDEIGKGEGPNWKLIVMNGIDVGMLLKVEIQSYGYKFYRPGPTMYFHVAGAAYHGPGGTHPGDKRELTEGDIAVYKEIDARIQKALVDFARFR